MSPRRPEQFEEMRNKSIRRIVSVATKLFSENGVYHTKVGQIAKGANISKALVYNYFDGKDGIEIAVIEECLQVFERIYVELPQDVDGYKKLESLLAIFFTSLREDFYHWHLYQMIIVQPEINQRFQELFYKNMSHFLSYLDSVFSEIAPNDTHTELMYFSSLLDGIAFDYILMKDKYPLEKMEKRVLKYYQNCFHKNCQ
jgi:AcrR family transcriptional regulator